MAKIDWFKMTVLAAIWGSSFIFMKILVPSLGVIPTACLRILISGVFLISALKILGHTLHAKKYLRHYLIIGFLNAALPFFLYSFASLHAPASLSVIMNSTTPIFGALFSVLWLGEKVTWSKSAGFFLGSVGVALIALHHPGGPSPTLADPTPIWLSGLAGLVAAACYAGAGIYIKRAAPGLSPFSMAGMSHLLGGLMLLPLAIQEWTIHPNHLEVLLNGNLRLLGALAGLSLLCSSIGFMIFYHLVERVGPTQSLTVGYLIPAFGILWGSLFLGESVSGGMLLGAALILSAVAVLSYRARTPESDALDAADLRSIIERELQVDLERTELGKIKRRVP